MELKEDRSSLREIPWPGPMPYEESHFRHFVGRESYIKNLIGRVQVARITILLGESGSGKTSLIRAGVVPKLRMGRYTGEGEARGAWPALLLREGGAKRDETVEMNWLRQLQGAIESMESWGRRYEQNGALEDAGFLRSAIDDCRGKTSSKSPFVTLIEELAIRQANRAVGTDASEGDESRGGGLILVFDQFEEQLRSGPLAQRDAFRLIRDIVVGGAPVRLLLSMRKEFRAELKDLERQIGELGRNSVHLERLERSKVLQVIERVSETGGIMIERPVAERIVGWLAHDGSAAGERLPEGSGENTGKLSRVEVLSAAPDLLKLQAVLVELCRWVVGRHEHSVTEDVFQRFVSELGYRSVRTGTWRDDQQDSEAQLGEVILGSALERWIEAALSREASASEEIQTPNGESIAGVKVSYSSLSNLPQEILRLQVRRIAVRMAPLLSSADYKVQQEETVLFRQALGEEIAKLPLKDPMRVNEIEIIENSEEGRLHLNWERLGGLNEPSGLKKWEVLAGPARGWTAEEAGDRLLACFKDTLERLSAANILRRTPVGNAGERKNYWELVHDQFGPNLVKWATNQKGTWEDCESSLVVCRGIQPLSVMTTEIAPQEGEEFYDLDGVSWQGCGIMQARLRPLTFRRVRFRNCFLVGTIFDAINFVECRFEGCLLKGGLFRNCTFLSTTFDHCDANIAIVGESGSISSLEFHDCHLLQPAIDFTSLLGEIRYTGGTRVIQGYFDVIPAGEEGKMRICFDSSSRAAFCLAGHNSFKLMNFENLELNISNSPLRDDNRVRLLG